MSFLRSQQLLLISIVCAACTSEPSGGEDPPADAPSQGATVPQMPASIKESWAALFNEKPASFPKVLNDLSFQSNRSDVQRVSPELLKTRRRTKGLSGWVQEGFPSVRISARVSAGTQLLRSVRIDFKGQALSTLTALWGPATEGQLEGGISAWFWFDEQRSVQAILQRNDQGDASLQYWPFIRLESVLKPPSEIPGPLVAEHLASLIGKPDSQVNPLYPEKVVHTGRNSFHGSLHPIRKEKRYFKVRFGVRDGVIESAEIKLQASVNPNLKGRLVELIKPGWGQPKTSVKEPSFQWEKAGVSLALYGLPAFDPNGPPPKRKPFLRLVFSRSETTETASPAP